MSIYFGTAASPVTLIPLLVTEHTVLYSETASLGSNTNGFEAVTAIIGIANTFGDVCKFKLYLDPDGPCALSSATRSDIHACGVTLVYTCGEGRQGAVGKMVLGEPLPEP
jgi:hypothetical protein